MKNLFPLFFLLVAASALSAQKEKATTSKEGIEWSTFRDSACQFQYPSKWDLDDSGMMGTRFILFSPLESDTDQFKENVNLIITDLGAPGIISLEQFAQAAQEQILGVISDAEVLRAELKGNAGANSDYYVVEFTGKQGKLPLHWQQRYWLKGSKAYILTFTAFHTAYAGYRELATKVLDSFALR